MPRAGAAVPGAWVPRAGARVPGAGAWCRGLGAGCLVLLAAGCSHSSAPADVAAAQSAAQPGANATAVPHGDHNPHHGGIVMMKGDLHYEVVLDKTGGAYQVFFTDAVREDLPASIASAVALTIKRPGEPAEPIAMTIDDAGESWIGKGRAVRDPLNTWATVAFTIAHEPYSVDVPFEIPPPR